VAGKIIAPPANAHNKNRALYDYWLKARARRDALPGRKDIDPTHIPRLLENIWMLDVVGAPPRFRVRLIGEAMRPLGIPAKVGDLSISSRARTARPIRISVSSSPSGSPSGSAARRQ